MTSKQVRVNFSKTTKLHEPVYNIQVLRCTKLHSKLCYYLLIINMKKSSQKIKTNKIFLRLCYNFAVVLHEECTRFQLIRSA